MLFVVSAVAVHHLQYQKIKIMILIPQTIVLFAANYSRIRVTCVKAVRGKYVMYVMKAKSVADRIANVSSLVNVGARYYKNCSKQLYSKKWGDEIRHDERKTNIDNAMEAVFAYLHENSEECQFRLADLMKSIKGDYIPEKRTVIERLKAKYKDDIVIFNEGKQDIIICFEGFIYKVISKRSSHKKNYPKEVKLQKVRDVAAIILEDIRSQHYETNQYPPSDNFLKEVNSLIPGSLSVLLSGIICQSKRKSLVAAQRTCTSIAHSIIGATRPASFISPLLLGVGSFLYKKYGFSNLINVLSTLGFSASYNFISLYEDFCAFRPARNILPHAFSQFVFDNADFNSNTIDD
ncbi:hypothetical protein JTB14_018511 [Gonioctena quinquepunctata]|nr:hypothetical protein JTB14_018511 [Gonioctena quinquepunctata]